MCVPLSSSSIIISHTILNHSTNSCPIYPPPIHQLVLPMVHTLWGILVWDDVQVDVCHVSINHHHHQLRTNTGWILVAITALLWCWVWWIHVWWCVILDDDDDRGTHTHSHPSTLYTNPNTWYSKVYTMMVTLPWIHYDGYSDMVIGMMADVLMMMMIDRHMTHIPNPTRDHDSVVSMRGWDHSHGEWMDGMLGTYDHGVWLCDLRWWWLIDTWHIPVTHSHYSPTSLDT